MQWFLQLQLVKISEPSLPHFDVASALKLPFSLEHYHTNVMETGTALHCSCSVNTLSKIFSLVVSIKVWVQLQVWIWRAYDSDLKLVHIIRDRSQFDDFCSGECVCVWGGAVGTWGWVMISWLALTQHYSWPLNMGRTWFHLHCAQRFRTQDDLDMCQSQLIYILYWPFHFI